MKTFQKHFRRHHICCASRRDTTVVPRLGSLCFVRIVILILAFDLNRCGISAVTLCEDGWFLAELVCIQFNVFEIMTNFSWSWTKDTMQIKSKFCVNRICFVSWFSVSWLHHISIEPLIGLKTSIVLLKTIVHNCMLYTKTNKKVTITRKLLNMKWRLYWYRNSRAEVMWTLVYFTFPQN